MENFEKLWVIISKVGSKFWQWEGYMSLKYSTLCLPLSTISSVLPSTRQLINYRVSILVTEDKQLFCRLQGLSTFSWYSRHPFPPCRPPHTWTPENQFKFIMLWPWRWDWISNWYLDSIILFGPDGWAIWPLLKKWTLLLNEYFGFKKMNILNEYSWF